MSSWLNPSSRRVSSACLARHLYASVKTINSQRQAANVTRICKYMERNHGITKADCIRELELCVRDGLLLFERSFGTKGSKKGTLQERYVIPDTYKFDEHDWYCFECHKGGEVICCSSCHRVYHTHCIKEHYTNSTSCYVCRDRNTVLITKEKLHRLLGYLCKNLRDLVPDTLRKWKRSESEKLLMNVLLYKHMDLYTIQQKISNLSYSTLLEFNADSKTFLHNMIIYYGDENSLTQEVRKMYEYCLHDIDEIEACSDCYEASNNREGDNWFCKPCKPLHKLVYAKSNNSPFWPAKVIKEFDNKYDVRFFGSAHSRAIVPKARVIPISPDIMCFKSLPSYGHTASWRKAISELKTHLICIGPQVKLKRLPVNFKVSDLLQSTNSNSKRVEKRKQNLECDGKKKVRSEANTEQKAVTEEVSDSRSFTDTMEQQTHQEVGDYDVGNFDHDSELETVSISELHEEIDIKDECIEEDDYITGNDPIQNGNCSSDDGTNQSDDVSCIIDNEQEHIQEVDAEHIVVKEESPCLQCSNIGLISSKAAERAKHEAVAKVKRHYEDLLAQMQEHYKNNLEDFKKVCSSGFTNESRVQFCHQKAYCNCLCCRRPHWQGRSDEGSKSPVVIDLK